MVRRVHLIAVALVISAASADFAAPVYTLDLDAPPEERWGQMALAQVKLHGWEHSYKPVLDFINGIVSAEMWQKFNTTLTAIGAPIIGEEFVRELNGIQRAATLVGQNVTLAELVFFQIFYELLMQCTGVLARSPDDSTANGGVFHGRNMDMGLNVQNITAQVDWQRGNETIMTTTQYIGYVGVHTGMRRGGSAAGTSGAGWSVQANERVVLSPGPIIGYQKATLLKMVTALLTRKGETVGKFLRDSLLAAPSFAEALPLLEDVGLASPMYLIVGGGQQGEGAVITRDRQGVATASMSGLPAPRGAGVRKLGDDGEWYVLETNWDWWTNKTHTDCDANMAKMPPVEKEACDAWVRLAYADKAGCDELCQLYSDGRREAATASMQALDPASADPAHLMTVMSKAPVLNGGTRFTSIMSAAADHYETTVRVGDAGGSAVTAAANTSAPSPHEAMALRFLLQELSGIPFVSMME